jgi:hypothetical protein
VSDSELADITRSYSFGPFIYGGAAAIAFASAWASAALYLAIAAFYGFPFDLLRAQIRRGRR